MTVDILLSTYNSEKYIETLLDSLVAQTFQDWRLIVRDDCSTDRTLSIIESYISKNNIKVTFINNENKNLGPKASFEKLLESSSSNYIMFCDHDDFWLPHKIENSLNRIQELEAKHHNQPTLVFTDVTVTDHRLNTVHHSFWSYSRINPDNVFNTYKLLINNPVLGCTIIINKAAKKIVLPIPGQAIMHDWWIALRLSETGIIDYIKNPSLLYRQHQKNDVGAEGIKRFHIRNRISNVKNTLAQNRRCYRMMKCLEKDYSVLKLLFIKLSITISRLF